MAATCDATDHAGKGRRQRGIALILVMVMLLLLSILGITVLNSTTADLQIAGTYRNEGDAFYVADAALEFAGVNAIIYNALAATAGGSWPPRGGGKILDGPAAGTDNTAYPDYNRMTVFKDAGNGREEGTANVKVEFVGSGPVPVGAGTEVDAGLGGGSGFKANFYVISVIADTPNNSHCEVESQIARVVPK